MTLRKVHARILIAGAWLLGTATATGGCLWATAHLGQGILGPGSQQLTVAAVNRALASETTEPAASPPGPAMPAPDPSASRMKFPAPSPGAGSGTPAAQGSPGAGTLLSSSGGSVTAACEAAGAYLLYWTPQQGYEATSVARGPASTATVTFTSAQDAVTMSVTCNGGVPVTSNSVSPNSHVDE